MIEETSEAKDELESLQQQKLKILRNNTIASVLFLHRWW